MLPQVSARDFKLYCVCLLVPVKPCDVLNLLRVPEKSSGHKVMCGVRSQIVSILTLLAAN